VAALGFQLPAILLLFGVAWLLAIGDVRFEGPFHALRTGLGNSEIATFLRANDYEPISQALYSTLYVARDWEALFQIRTL